jgi:WD repeat-containing protein 35
VDSKYIEVEPKFLCLTNYHVIAANEEVVYCWQFRTSFSKILSTDINAVKRKDVREKIFHIDESNPSQVGTKFDVKSSGPSTVDNSYP